MKRPAKTKRVAKAMRRTPAKPVAAPAPITASDQMLAAAAILVSGKDGPDGRVTELFLSWCCLRVLQEVMFAHERDLGRRAHAEGRDEAECPALRAIRRTQKSFFPHERQLIQAIAAVPADTPRGLALKLLVWRWESCHTTDGSLSDIDEIAVYSAYRDALKAAGLTSLAHPRDALTELLLAAGKALEYDSDED